MSRNPVMDQFDVTLNQDELGGVLDYAQETFAEHPTPDCTENQYDAAFWLAVIIGQCHLFGTFTWFQQKPATMPSAMSLVAAVAVGRKRLYQLYETMKSLSKVEGEEEQHDVASAVLSGFMEILALTECAEWEWAQQQEVSRNFVIFEMAERDATELKEGLLAIEPDTLFMELAGADNLKNNFRAMMSGGSWKDPLMPWFLQ